ncbi:MAG TPA: hypothetical protein VJT31_09195 [Rugosimonospora sp.]|nr:hypothetical protein [Rugosimonospora sp.]
MSHVLPASLAVRNLLEDLLGREVTVSPAEPPRAEHLRTATVAVYVDDTLRLSAVLALDLRLAAFAGAALGLMPVGGAEDCIDEKNLSPVLAENVSELCNVLTGLLNREGGRHLRLYQLHLPGAALPSDVGAHALALGNRLDLNVDVARYGAGQLWLSLV